VSQCFLAATRQQAIEAKAVAPEIRICNMSGRQPLGAYAKLTIELHADFLQILDTPEKEIPEGLAQVVQELHKNHVTVNYFSADDDAKIQALEGAGVDYVLTNNLDLAQRVLATSHPRTGNDTLSGK
jgi:glycerophosphoryl diester phosphodiesterase